MTERVVYVGGHLRTESGVRVPPGAVDSSNPLELHDEDGAVYATTRLTATAGGAAANALVEVMASPDDNGVTLFAGDSWVKIAASAQVGQTEPLLVLYDEAGAECFQVAADGVITGTAPPVNVVGAAGQPAFQNSWTSFPGYGPVGYWLDGTGMVHLQGITQCLADPVANSIIFTLPVGYRPALPRYMSTVSNALTNTFLFVEADGDVGVSANFAINVAVYLDGLSFRL